MDPIGRIQPPNSTPGIDPTTGELIGVLSLLNSILKLFFIAAGIWVFFNFILAGFGFINAGGDPKAISKAWEKIWRSLVGLLIIVASFLIAAVIGILFFKDPSAILNPKLK